MNDSACKLSGSLLLVRRSSLCLDCNLLLFNMTQPLVTGKSVGLWEIGGQRLLCYTSNIVLFADLFDH